MYMSYDLLSRTVVMPFGGRVQTAPHLGAQIPQKDNLWPAWDLIDTRQYWEHRHTNEVPLWHIFPAPQIRLRYTFLCSLYV